MRAIWQVNLDTRKGPGAERGWLCPSFFLEHPDLFLSSWSLFCQPRDNFFLVVVAVFFFFKWTNTDTGYTVFRNKRK